MGEEGRGWLQGLVQRRRVGPLGCQFLVGFDPEYAPKVMKTLCDYYVASI